MSRGTQTATLASWERQVFALAREGQGIHAFGNAPLTLIGPASFLHDEQVLQDAYAHCEKVTATHSRSFYLAARLLPAHMRPAMHALYAFCRTSDDIVDRTRESGERSSNTRETLDLWRAKTLGAVPAQGDPVAIAWSHTRQRYNIPQRYAQQLLDGVERDLYQSRYQTFEELATYAYGVASTVGLMSMTITGYAGPQAIPYAVKLGIALQLTNILRDVGEDWRNGRLYLPQAELARFDLCEDDLAMGKVDGRWRAFMRFQIARNRRLYLEAWPGLAFLSADGRLAITAAARLYAAILDDIEAHDYDVFSRRAHTGRARKMLELLRAWRDARQPVQTELEHAAL